MQSDFEAFRRGRSSQKRRHVQAERPAGHTEVWTQIEERERHELKERQINAEVEDFFADATRLAANIVKKVSETHKQEITDKLRREMEEFLIESIRHATNMIMGLGAEKAAGGERIVETSVRNLGSSILDDFRAAGTARLADKHLGVDPFGVELQAVAEELRRRHAEDERLDVHAEQLHLTDSELTLDAPQEPAYGVDEFADSDESQAEAAPEPPYAEDDDVPLAAQYAQPQPEEAEEDEDAEPVATELDPKVDAKVRAALALLVRHEALTRDQARMIYRRFRS